MPGEMKPIAEYEYAVGRLRELPAPSYSKEELALVQTFQIITVNPNILCTTMVGGKEVTIPLVNDRFEDRVLV